MIKIAVIAGQSGAEIVSELHKRNCEVLLVCGKENESGSDAADHLLVHDLQDAELILERIKGYSNNLFLGTGHRFAINLAKEFLGDGRHLNFDPDGASLFKNKLSTHEFVSKLGFNSPLLKIIADAEDTFIPDSFPVVVKSEEDTFKTQLVNDSETFSVVKNGILQTGSRVLIERFIDGFEVTIPVWAERGNVRAVRNSLNMKDINKKAVSILKGFDLDREAERIKSIPFESIVDEGVKDRIVDIVEKIITEANYYGYPRFDIMVDFNKDIYVLEVNSIMVTALGGTHYPWEDVRINPAADMVDLFLRHIDKNVQ